MATANETLFDLTLRHEVAVRRFTKGEVRRVLDLATRTDNEIAAKLLRELPESFAATRLRELLADCRRLRRVLTNMLRESFNETLIQVAEMEQDAAARNVRDSLAVEVSLAAVSAEALRVAALTTRIHDKLLKEWWDKVAEREQKRILEALRLGYAQGESIPEMVRRIRGTRANNFEDGIISGTRRDIEAVVRTGINDVSNKVRGQFFDANADLVACLRWTSTLDGRTTPICRARDGHMAPVAGKPLPSGLPRLDPPEARPPAHVNCRSVMVAVLDGSGVVGNRPFVRGKKSIGELRFPTPEARKEWIARNVGRVPAETTYEQWLARQPREFQDDVLGPRRGKLFREGGLTLDQFVDRSGKELTLKQLRGMYPSAFGE